MTQLTQDVAKTGASATGWATAVSSIVGGKAGGKGATSQGIGQDPTKVEEAIEVAEKFIEEKLAKLNL